MHILEMHINEYRFGLMGEQVTEAIHAHLISYTGRMAVWPIKWSG